MENAYLSKKARALSEVAAAMRQKRLGKPNLTKHNCELVAAIKRAYLIIGSSKMPLYERVRFNARVLDLETTLKYPPDKIALNSYLLTEDMRCRRQLNAIRREKKADDFRSNFE